MSMEKVSSLLTFFYYVFYPSMGKYVYLLFSNDTGFYKIGISKNPYNRVKQLQTGNHEQIKLLEAFYSTFYMEIEKGLHTMYNPLQKQGEWFNLSLEEELSFLKECTRLDSYFKLKNEDFDF